MIKQLALAVALSGCALAANAGSIDAVITGVFDGPLTGGIPKFVEVRFNEALPDASVCGIGSANNGGGTDGQEFTFPAVAVSAGQFVYVASEAAQFEVYMGFPPDYTSSAADINGDDAIELFCNGAVIDVFGDINVDGTGEPWDHLDGWAYRVVGTGPDGSTFELNNWTFSGVDATDGCTTNAGCASVFPQQTYPVELMQFEVE
jgi:hypothetical protein